VKIKNFRIENGLASRFGFIVVPSDTIAFPTYGRIDSLNANINQSSIFRLNGDKLRMFSLSPAA
jgi:hypothetical protein